MTKRELLLHSTSKSKLSTSEFLWRSVGSGDSSFHVAIDPELAAIGDVPLPNRDVVALGVTVFLSDRTVRRPRPQGWERKIEIALPVYQLKEWEEASNGFEHLLDVLTSDAWTLNLRKRAASKKVKPVDRQEADLVSLFSGGADSLCGAVRSLGEGRRTLLVSHWDWGVYSSYQRRLASWLTERFPEYVIHRQFQVSRAAEQLGGGAFGAELTRRSRSLLFIALGTAVASVAPSLPLWIPENGYSSLNPPLSGERRGSLSTRTTHPLFLSELRQLMTTVGAHADFSNPFGAVTKGEMFREVASSLGVGDAADLLSMSHSCAHVRWAIGTGLPPDTQCGVCYGCLVRRAAFLAVDLPDATTYLHTALDREDQPPHLHRAAVSELKTIQYAVERGIRPADILSNGLPSDQTLDDAVNVAQRGLDELRNLIETAPDLVELN